MRALLPRRAHRRRPLRHVAGIVARNLPVPEATVSAAWLLRLAGYAVGDTAKRAYVVRAGCRIDVMRLPPEARAIATGRPVRQVRMSLVSWARVFLWRLAGRL